jgi:hypothetical protein
MEAVGRRRDDRTGRLALAELAASGQGIKDEATGLWHLPFAGDTGPQGARALEGMSA